MSDPRPADELDAIKARLTSGFYGSQGMRTREDVATLLALAERLTADVKELERTIGELCKANAEVARCREALRQSQEALIAELDKPKKRSHRRKEETK